MSNYELLVELTEVQTRLSFTLAELAACQRSRTLLHLENAWLRAEYNDDKEASRTAYAAYMAYGREAQP